MSLYSEGAINGAVGENFNELLTVDETGCAKFFKTNLGDVLLFSESCNELQVDSFVFLAVDIVEAPLRETTLKRHLATFEADFTLVATAGFGTFVTTSRSATFARAGSTANTSRALY